MHILSWIALIIGTAGFGAGIVCILIVPRRIELRCAISGILAFSLAVWAFLNLISAYGRADIAIYASLFSIAGVVGGYGLASTLLGTIARRPGRVTVPEGLPTALPGTAVILVANAEPEQYDPRTTASDLEELADEDSLEQSIALTPFLYAAQKARYRAVGGKSPASDEVDSIVLSLREELDESQYPLVSTVCCASNRNLAKVVVRAVEDGYRDFVIIGLTVAESYQIDRAKCDVDGLRLDRAGLRLAYAPPLWASETLAAMVATRILNSVESPAVTGVALVAHGQPLHLRRTHSAFDAQEQSFLNRVRLLLLEAGLEDHLIRLAWSHWRDPDVSETIRHLAALGAEKILVCPACDPVDTISTLLDLPLSSRQARVDPPARIVQLGAWGNGAAVTKALVTAVRDTERELDGG